MLAFAGGITETCVQPPSSGMWENEKTQAKRTRSVVNKTKMSLANELSVESCSCAQTISTTTRKFTKEPYSCEIHNALPHRK
jgi:hypothetical protein